MATTLQEKAYICELNKRVAELEEGGSLLSIFRMTKAERDSLANPQDGMIVFQTDDQVGLKFRAGGAWHEFVTHPEHH